MELIDLNDAQQVQDIAQSKNDAVILKHNTTCSISMGVLDRIKQSTAVIPGIDNIFLLDLLQHRDLSNQVAETFDVPHQSPQLLFIRNGKCIYTEWGFDISAEATRDAVNKP